MKCSCAIGREVRLTAGDKVITTMPRKHEDGEIGTISDLRPYDGPHVYSCWMWKFKGGWFGTIYLRETWLQKIS